jgi:hypothetical protein
MNIDIPLLGYFAAWYIGNYYYNIQNKNAAIATGGVRSPLLYFFFKIKYF